MNTCVFLGNLTRDPELREVGSSGKKVVNFTIAVNRYFKRGDERASEACFIDCEAWDSGAETIHKYSKKGEPILVQGSMKQEEWDDKTTGQKRSKLKLRVEKFQFISNGKKSQTVPDEDKEPVAPNEPTLAGDTDGGDIPF